MMKFTANLMPRPSAGAVAMIATAKDEVGEEAFRQIVSKRGVTVYTTRTVYTDDEPDENGDFHFLTPFNKVAEAFPDSEKLDVLAFGCTSGTVATGVDEITRKLREARPGLKYTTPGIAALKALKARNTKTISLLTPYPEYMHHMFLTFFQAKGLSILSNGTFDTAEGDIGRVSPADLLSASRMLLKDANPDALYISCTAIDIVNHIDWLENELSVPILTSTQALAWDCLNALDLRPSVPGFGSLLA